MTADALTARHRPARADIPRAGTTSGMDVALPPNCATATCHHREHQLSRSEPVFVTTGWAAPSHMFVSPGRLCNLVVKRRWWQLWQPREEMWPQLCTDPECPRTHYEVEPLAETLLELPAISIRRGGIRFPTNEETRT